MEQGPADRPETPIETEGDLDHPRPPAACSDADATLHCSISRSTASCAAATSSGCASNDVCIGGQVRDRATIIQRKTGRPVQFEITEQTRAAILDWLGNRPPWSGQFLFPSRRRNQLHLSTRQYARIVHRWVERAGLDSSVYGTHSLRRTKAAQIYKKTGNLRAVQLLLGHTKLESTVRYLGIEVDDALAISEQIEI
jgi:hypothetical protein